MLRGFLILNFPTVQFLLLLCRVFLSGTSNCSPGPNNWDSLALQHWQHLPCREQLNFHGSVEGLELWLLPSRQNTSFTSCCLRVPTSPALRARCVSRGLGRVLGGSWAEGGRPAGACPGLGVGTGAASCSPWPQSCLVPRHPGWQMCLCSWERDGGTGVVSP